MSLEENLEPYGTRLAAPRTQVMCATPPTPSSAWTSWMDLLLLSARLPNPSGPVLSVEVPCPPLGCQRCASVRQSPWPVGTLPEISATARKDAGIGGQGGNQGSMDGWSPCGPPCPGPACGFGIYVTFWNPMFDGTCSSSPMACPCPGPGGGCDGDRLLTSFLVSSGCEKNQKARFTALGGDNQQHQVDRKTTRISIMKNCHPNRSSR